MVLDDLQFIEAWLTESENDCSQYEEISDKSEWCVTGNFENSEDEYSPDKAIDTHISNETTGYFQSCGDEAYLEVLLYFCQI